MNSGWAAKLGSSDHRNTPEGAFAFPGFSRAATDMLAGRHVVAIGVGTLPLDPGSSAGLAVHSGWLPGGRFGIETLADLDRMPVTGAAVFIGAPTRRGVACGPAGAAAMIAVAPRTNAPATAMQDETDAPFLA